MSQKAPIWGLGADIKSWAESYVSFVSNIDDGKAKLKATLMETLQEAKN